MNKLYNFIEMLKHKKPHMRVQGLHGLSKLKNKRDPHVYAAVAPICELLEREQDEAVSAAAIAALGAIIGEYHAIVLHQGHGPPDAIMAITEELRRKVDSEHHDALSPVLQRLGDAGAELWQEKMASGDEREDHL